MEGYADAVDRAGFAPPGVVPARQGDGPAMRAQHGVGVYSGQAGVVTRTGDWSDVTVVDAEGQRTPQSWSGERNERGQ